MHYPKNDKFDLNVSSVIVLAGNAATSDAKRSGRKQTRTSSTRVASNATKISTRQEVHARAIILPLFLHDFFTTISTKRMNVYERKKKNYARNDLQVTQEVPGRCESGRRRSD